MFQSVAKRMHTFFVPQMEQLGLREQDARHGSLSTMKSDMGTGVLWALSLADDCLYTYYDVRPKTDISFMEYPDDSICISFMSKDSAKQVPLREFAMRDWKDRNILSFRMTNAPMNCHVNQDEHCCSHSILLLPSYFERLEGFSDTEQQMLFDFLSASDEGKLPAVLAAMFSGLVPTLSRHPGGEMYCKAKVNEILSVIADSAFAQAEDDGFAGMKPAAVERLSGKESASSAERNAVACETKRIIDERFNENLTTLKLSKELFVGRTRLCEAFRDEYHLGVGEYLRIRRMEEAARMLADTDLAISQIADAVGYAHASSFIEAYRKHYGESPAHVREQACEGSVEITSNDSLYDPLDQLLVRSPCDI